jgi:hypothetical protein
MSSVLAKHKAENEAKNTPEAQHSSTTVKNSPATQQRPGSTLNGIEEETRIRKVPVEELAFPAQGVLAPGLISTHTDGAPSSAALSGLSLSVSAAPSPIVNNCSDNTLLVGLGIQNASTAEPASLLHGDVDERTSTKTVAPKERVMADLIDSPITDSGLANALPAAADGIKVIDGKRYVPESKYLDLKRLLEQLRPADSELDKAFKSDLTRTNNFAASLSSIVVEATSASTGQRSPPADTIHVPIKSKDNAESDNLAISYTPTIGTSEPVITDQGTPRGEGVKEQKISEVAAPLKGIMSSRWAPRPAAAKVVSQSTTEHGKLNNGTIMTTSTILGDSKNVARSSQPRGYNGPAAKGVAIPKPPISPGPGYHNLVKELGGKVEESGLFFSNPEPIDYGDEL